MKCPEFSPNFSFSCCRSSIPKKLNGILSADNICEVLWSLNLIWGMLYLASYQFPNTKSIDNCKWSSLHRLDLLSQWATYRCAPLFHLASCNCRPILQRLSHLLRVTANDSFTCDSHRIWLRQFWWGGIWIYLSSSCLDSMFLLTSIDACELQ